MARKRERMIPIYGYFLFGGATWVKIMAAKQIAIKRKKMAFIKFFFFSLIR